MAWCRAVLVGDNPSDSVCLFLNNYHLSSLTVLIVACGWYVWQTNCSILSRVSLSGFSSLLRLAKDLMIDSLAFSNSFQHVSFPFPEKLPALSTPVKAGSVAVLADPNGSTIGSERCCWSSHKTCIWTHLWLVSDSLHYNISVRRIDRKFESTISSCI